MSFVSGAGSTNIDLIYSGLPRIPNEGEELYSESFSLQMGGGVPATLINLGGLGVPTRIQTLLGSDIFSGFAQQMFEQNGVAPLNLYSGAGIPLNVTTALLTPGDRTFVSFTDAPPITDDMLDRVYADSKGAKIVEMNLGYLEVYRKLKAEGTTLVFDMGWDDELSLAKYKDYIDVADYYTPNQKEALKITDTDTPEKAAEVLSEHFEKVIVKLDKDGCLIRENGKNQVIPNLPVVHRDSTGAGDAFLSGLLYGLYHDYSFAESILFGNITGGKCVTAVGCLGAQRTEEELLASFKKYAHFLNA